MTYDYACGTRKRFIDDLVQCGEDSQNQHACACTNAQKQNSFGTLLDIFGPRTNKPPTAEIDVPVDGATVQTGFAVTVTAKDDIRVTKVELFVDGSFYQRSELGGPTTWTFTTDSGLPGGNHSLVVVAYDAGGLTAQSAPVQITVEPPCSGNDDCDDGQVCNLASGQCVAGPGQPGGIGSTCTDNSACDSELCAQGPDGMRCVTLCTPGGNDCPDGFDCLGAGGGGACWPGADALDPPGDGGCGCTTGRHHGAGVASAFAFLFLAFAATRRRRSR
jgi:MYXO-CTERM domain-containing protein